MDNLLDRYLELAEMLPHLFPGDIAATVTDREKHLVMVQAKTFHMNVKVNDPINEKGGIYKAIHTGTSIVANIPIQLYGFPVITHTVPLFDPISGEVAGAMSVAVSQARETLVVDMANELQQHSGSMENTASGIVKVAADLSTQSNLMSERIGKVTDQIKKMDGIIGYIKSVSVTSNLLGLNASIEAARAGEAGRGFSVVAEEIRKLAISSQDSSTEILKTLNNLRADINDLIGGVQALSQISANQQGQAATISTESSQLSQMSQKLKAIADELV